MKRFALLITFISLVFGTHAKDIIQLENGMMFEGKVKKFSNCQLTFKAGKDTYVIPASDINQVGFAEHTNKVARQFYDMEAAGYTNCSEGKADAKAFHGKIAKHVISGIIFGPVGTIFALIGNPAPRKGKRTKRLSDNSDLFSNPQYLACYKKEAKKNNILYTLIGWVVIPTIIAISAN